MHLTTFETDEQTVTAGYGCPCGCAPLVTHERGSEPARSLCCCGNEFVVGPDAERSLQPRRTVWAASLGSFFIGSPDSLGAVDDEDSQC